MAIYESATIKHDGIMAGPEFPVLTKNYPITAGTALKRGTLLAITDGQAAAVAKGGEASAIVVNDVDDTATVVTAYVTGLFYREGLIVAEGDNVSDHEEELRKIGIHLTSRK